MSVKFRIGIVGSLVIAISLAHYLIDPSQAAVHEILQRVYYLPVVLAGLWFGMKGGLLTALVISIIYYPHALHGWMGSSFIFRLIEMLMFHVVGGLCGYLSSRTQQALEAEKQARAEEEILRKEKEAAYNRLYEKTEELFTLEEQLRRSDRLAALGKLSAGLAHEIRNPLGSIRTSVEYLQRKYAGAEEEKPPSADGSEEEPPDFFAILLEETERLNKTVSGFLEFARQEHGKASDEPALCQVQDAFNSTIELLGLQLKSRKIEMEFKEFRSGMTAKIAENHLCQILLNLFLNSLQAIEGEGWIKVIARPDSGENVRLIVEDSGPGIPPELAEIIFDPFYSDKQDGTGLGLSIVERIVNSYGGTITLNKNQKISSRFDIILPAVSRQP